MEMRNIIAFRCSIMGRGIAARPCAAFTFGTSHTRMRANRLHRKDNRTGKFSLFLLQMEMQKEICSFFRNDRNTGLQIF